MKYLTSNEFNTKNMLQHHLKHMVAPQGTTTYFS
jgi:hypothetical protein